MTKQNLSLYSTIYYDRPRQVYSYILCIREDPSNNPQLSPWIKRISREVLSPFETFSSTRQVYTNKCIYALWNKVTHEFFTLDQLTDAIFLFQSLDYAFREDLTHAFSRTQWMRNPDTFIGIIQKIEI